MAIPLHPFLYLAVLRPNFEHSLPVNPPLRVVTGPVYGYRYRTSIFQALLQGLYPAFLGYFLGDMPINSVNAFWSPYRLMPKAASKDFGERSDGVFSRMWLQTRSTSSAFLLFVWIILQACNGTGLIHVKDVLPNSCSIYVLWVSAFLNYRISLRKK